jgi:hypothetical protein
MTAEFDQAPTITDLHAQRDALVQRAIREQHRIVNAELSDFAELDIFHRLMDSLNVDCTYIGQPVEVEGNHVSISQGGFLDQLMYGKGESTQLSHGISRGVSYGFSVATLSEREFGTDRTINRRALCHRVEVGSRTGYDNEGNTVQIPISHDFPVEQSRLHFDDELSADTMRQLRQDETLPIFDEIDMLLLNDGPPMSQRLRDLDTIITAAELNDNDLQTVIQYLNGLRPFRSFQHLMAEYMLVLTSDQPDHYEMWGMDDEFPYKTLRVERFTRTSRYDITGMPKSPPQALPPSVGLLGPFTLNKIAIVHFPLNQKIAFEHES